MVLARSQTKTYHIYDEDGEPMLHRAEGTDIQWKSGKNVTVKVHHPIRALDRHMWPHVRLSSSL